ncbi:MAG: L,D-transpeptidase family protein [Erythrobacter sp.]|jgi:murein L,D-transpeptidase YafK|nr:L,D-transpeptidase family protein [Erythrobacter sp.]
MMHRIAALFPALWFALLLAACSSGPPPKVVAAPGEGVAIPVRPDGAIARRALPAPSGPQVADYLLVDKSERLLIAYAGGQPIRAYRGIQFGDAPQGHKRFEGDERTPEGRYVIDTRNPQSRYHLSLRISYPNGTDRAYAASRGRSPGGDIFIHGQPNWLASGRMPGDWTDGCIALSNAEIEELWRLVPGGTVIDIRP